MNCKTIYLTFSCLLATTATAADFCGKAAQGEILVGKQAGASSVISNGQELRISPEGEFLIAFGRDEQKSRKISFITPDNEVVSLELEVAPTKWDVQSLKGVPPRKVTPSDSDLRDIEKETKLVRAGQADDTEIPYWKKGFIRPVEGRISGNFGGQRIMNGIKKNPHGGMDIAVPEGTPVKAASDGVVTLAAPDLFYSGNVIVIDHGYGLHTIYAHLNEMHIKRGDKVIQGQTIALSGKTGRVTGPHLHWGASYKGTRFNPTSLLNINKSNDFCFNL